MPVYRQEPHQLTDQQYLKGKSWFHWCPNTHLHPRTRMHSLWELRVDSWGKVDNYHVGWYCIECGLVEEIGWED